MKHKWPIFIPSKGRAQLRYTSRALDFMGANYRIVVEPQEADEYIREVGKDKVIVMDLSYKDKYELCDEHGLTRSTGPGPARNFAWDVSIAEGYEWHWVCDDNIYNFLRLNNNLKIKVADTTIFRCMEDFCERYENVAMAGPNYRSFAPQNSQIPAYVTNTRIYSCNLIRNDVNFRWRGRYNEDTILSLDMLKAGWCTVQFNAFLQDKMRTQTIGGGNTGEFYANEGTIRKSVMLKDIHPDVTDLVWKFGREHHHVNYNPYKNLQLKRKPGIVVKDEIDDYGMKIKSFAPDYPGRV